jgi:hypothetical protein
MATINLGAIKFNWKGAYNSSTTYAVDDVVSSGGNSYVCIQAHSNQAVGNATAYWNIMSSKGTDADLLNISSTAQGDIYYNNGSAIARLGAGTSGQVLQTGGSGANPSWTTVSTEVVNTTMNAFQDAVNAGDRRRNPYIWTRYNTAVTVTDANNYFLWEVNGYTNHDNHPAGSVEVQEDSGSFVNAYNKSTLTGTAIVQANGQSSWGSNDHLSRYPHMRFDTAVNTNNNYAQPSSAQGIYKPTGTPTTLNFRVSFWSENSTSNLIIGANPSGGSSHGCAPISYLKITEIKA